jgi:hypothetical protein
LTTNEDKIPSCTDILIQALEDFGIAEPTSLVLLYTNKDGELVITRNASHTQTIGLCEYGKECAIRRIFE